MISAKYLMHLARNKQHEATLFQAMWHYVRCIANELLIVSEVTRHGERDQKQMLRVLLNV